MAHEIEVDQATGRAAFYSLREDAWHRLGTVTQDAKTVEEALALANLSNWNLRTQPLYTVINGEYVEVPSRVALVRDNPFEDGKVDIIDEPGKGHVAIPNEAHAELLDTLLAESGAVVETAGSMRDGKDVFITMRLPETMQVGGKDAVDTYIAALNSHDRSAKFRFIVTPLRVVCKNTQVAAERVATASFGVRHTANATKQIQAQARAALDLTYKYQGAFQIEADKMIDAELTNKAFDDIVRRLFPVDKQAGKITQDRQQTRLASLRDLFRDSPTAEEIRGTRWAGYQAVTEYFDWFTPVRSSDDEQEAIRRAAKTLSADVTADKAKAFSAFQVK